MKNLKAKGLLLVAGIIVAGIFARLIPHLPNYAPIGALTLFGSAYLGRKYLAVMVPIIALFVSDFIINNTLYAQYYDGIAFFSFFQIFTFGAIALTALLGFLSLKKVNLFRVLGSTAMASVLFYMITSFGTWIDPVSIYSANVAGLITCYAAGIPFFLNTLLSNMLFGAVLFGGFEYFSNFYPSFNLKKQDVLS